MLSALTTLGRKLGWRPANPTLPPTTRSEQDLMQAEGGRLSPWRHDSFKKPLTLQNNRSGEVYDTAPDPRPELTELPPNWKVLPDGFYCVTPCRCP